ncbi:MAG: GIY-YIG nuclease family protein [Clostridioides sp.]|jgi:putative endonuclease|nr:GIY-YIG nuclease family protein [Clostridioides sp.]
MFFTYIISCKDDTLYTGYTVDIKRRLNEHRLGINSKYTKAKGFKKLEIVFVSDSKSKAMKLEYHIKKLSRQEKINMIKTQQLSQKLKVAIEDYKIHNLSENNV